MSGYLESCRQCAGSPVPGNTDPAFCRKIPVVPLCRIQRGFPNLPVTAARMRVRAVQVRSEEAWNRDFRGKLRIRNLWGLTSGCVVSRDTEWEFHE